MENNQLNQQHTAQVQTSADYEGDEIDLRALFSILWAEKWLIIGVTALFAIGSVIYALRQTDIYRAEAVLAPAEEQQATGTGQFAGAAALLGVSLGGGGDNVSTAIATLRSRQFLGRFINENDLWIPLFAGRWDNRAQASYIDEDVYNLEVGEWVSEAGQPDQNDAYRMLSNILSVTDLDQNSGLLTIAIDWHNPIEAADWVNKLVEGINRDVRSRDVREANSAITFLRNQLDLTQLVEMQRVFYQLIESQTRVVMLADVRDEYVFQVIDPAVVPDQKFAPNRISIVIFGGLLGLILSIFITAVLRYFGKREPQFK